MKLSEISNSVPSKESVTNNKGSDQGGIFEQMVNYGCNSQSMNQLEGAITVLMVLAGSGNLDPTTLNALTAVYNEMQQVPAPNFAELLNGLKELQGMPTYTQPVAKADIFTDLIDMMNLPFGGGNLPYTINQDQLQGVISAFSEIKDLLLAAPMTLSPDIITNFQNYIDQLSQYQMGSDPSTYLTNALTYIQGSLAAYSWPIRALETIQASFNNSDYDGALKEIQTFESNFQYYSQYLPYGLYNDITNFFTYVNSNLMQPYSPVVIGQCKTDVQELLDQLNS